MPDITMCNSETCSMRNNCYRNPESGIKPSKYRQSWFMGLDEEGSSCSYYWPTRGNTNDAD